MGWRNLQDEIVFGTGDVTEIFSVKVCVMTVGCK